MGLSPAVRVSLNHEEGHPGALCLKPALLLLGSCMEPSGCLPTLCLQPTSNGGLRFSAPPSPMPSPSFPLGHGLTPSAPPGTPSNPSQLWLWGHLCWDLKREVKNQSKV